jgi:hypothetical protein
MRVRRTQKKPKNIAKRPATIPAAGKASRKDTPSFFMRMPVV